MPFSNRKWRRARSRSGQVLAEFAVVSLVLFLLLATILEFGRALSVSQQLQTIADVAAREYATVPFAANETWDQARQTPEGLELYDERYLVIAASDVAGFSSADLDIYFADKPIVNRLLRPLMILDQVQGETVLRYPGAIVDRGDYSTVRIPIVTARDEDGVETLEWRDVVEEVKPVGGTSPFVVGNAADQPGVVALRINYPYQAAAVSGFQGPPENQTPIVANDAGVNAGDAGGTLVAPDAPTDDDPHRRMYAGEYGLGEQLALGQELRPFRRVLSAQAIYRRELFE